jgi:uncharacterized membrane protein
VTKTRPTIILLIGVLGIAGGWFVQVARVATGRSVVVPPYSLALVLALLGVAIVFYAVPVYRVVQRTATRPVDPFYATRVVLLAKASSITGSLLGGIGVGFLAFLLTRSVIPAVGSVSMTAFATVGAAVLLAGGLIAEKMCTLPPDDDQKNESTSVAQRPE